VTPTSRALVGVLVVDDSPTFRRAAVAVIDMTDGFEVVGEAASGEDALQMAASLRPDLVLLDVNMPGLGGLAALDAFRRDRPETQVVLVSTYGPADLPSDVRAAGTTYLHKARLTPESIHALWNEANKHGVEDRR
jgi:DNA-binding NarL/FixJ family response regulator